MQLLNIKWMFCGLLVLSLGTAHANTDCKGLYNHQFKTLQGKTLDLCQYQDKPILVVNTASKCGFTPQFEALESLYSQYKEQGLMIVGFPSNDFKQELSSNKAIGDFCKMNYQVKFPMIEKSSVVGDQANPLYQQLIAKTGKSPMWNFYKYLILPEAKQVHLYNSLVQPDAKSIMNKVKPHLK